MVSTSAVLGQNYTGPYISDGKFQKSVAFGDSKPLSALDSISRLHDTAYVYYGNDVGHLMAADSLYNERAKQIGGSTAPLAGAVVTFGNSVVGSLSNLSRTVSTGFKVAGLPGALGGLIYGGVENALNLYDYATHRDEYIKDILKMETLDPHPEYLDVPNESKQVTPLGKGTLPKIRDKGINVDAARPPTRAANGSGGSEIPSDKLVYEPLVGINCQSSVSPTYQWLGGGENKQWLKRKRKRNKYKSEHPRRQW